MQKKTVLYEEHLSLGAMMGEFATWLMPLKYESERNEHLAVRKMAGLFDVSHMGILLIAGAETLDVLQRLLTSDISQLKVGKACYSLMLDEDAGIIDDLICYRIKNEAYLMIVNAANLQKDFLHISNIIKGARAYIENISSQKALIALQGPSSEEILSGVFLGKAPKRNEIKEMNLLNINKNALVARTGYTGESGFEIMIEKDQACSLWKELLKVGKPYGLSPCGLIARDSLRLEAGLLLHGSDITAKNNPLEADLMHFVKFEKSPLFIGCDALLRKIREGSKKKLVGFVLLEKGILRAHCKIFSREGDLIGEITSGTLLPRHVFSIGLGYIKIPYSQVGTKVCIDIRGRNICAAVSKRSHLVKYE